MGAEAPGLCAAPGGGGIPRSEDQGTRPIRSSPMKRPTFALKIHPAKLEIERRFDRIPPSTGFQPRLEGPTWSDRANRPAAIVGTILWLSVPRSDRDTVASRDRSRASWRGRFGENPTRGAEAGHGRHRFLLFFHPGDTPTPTPSILARADRSAATTPHPTLAGGILQRTDAGGATAGGGAHHGRETQARRPRPGAPGQPSRGQMQQMLGTSGGSGGMTQIKQEGGGTLGVTPRWSGSP